MTRLFAYDATGASLTRPCKPPFFNGWLPRSDASLCCELSRLAYCEGSPVGSALAAVAMELVAEFSEPAGDGTYAFLAQGEQKAVLAFRGTQADDPTDIIDDARFLPEPWPAGGNVHAGFADALGRVWAQITPHLDALDRPVLFTGHSLGAALAVLAATLRPPARVITFGSPRVGNASFCALLEASAPCDRFVNCCDLVCQVPPAPYQHAGKLHYLDRDGSLRVDPPEWLTVVDQATAHTEFVRDHAWRFGNVVSRSLADHSPINYVSALAPVG